MRFIMGHVVRSRKNTFITEEEQTMQRTFSKFAIVAATFAAIVAITVLTTGEPASPHRIGVVNDWSNHHLVFSNPGTYEAAVKTHASYAKWLTIRYDTRFILQQMKRHAEPTGMVEPENLAIGALWQLPGEAIAQPKPAPEPRPSPLKRLWTEGLSKGTVQPNAYPAKWGPSLTAGSCQYDYVAYPTGTAGSASAASIVAYYNLYSPCGGSVPSIYWAFNTGGTISTSPILSLDGTQVAFIQVSGTDASLVLLKPFFTVQGTVTAGSNTVTITSGTVTSADIGMQISGPGVPVGDTVSSVSGSTVTMATAANASYTAETLDITAVPGTVNTPISLTSQASGSAYRGCAAPCMLTLPLSGSVNDTLSAPFYDYSNDAIHVGDDSGNLHMFTGVFNGTPAEATSPWPVPVSGNKLTCPVYDSVTGNVLVGDTGGYFYSVSPAAIIAKSGNLGDVIMDAPLVDSSAGMAYVFVTTNNDTKTPSNAVFQFSTNFSAGSTGNGAATGTEVGPGGAGFYLYAGDFDNVYYQSSVPPSGNLYVIGNTSSTTGATLYQIPITNNSMGVAKGVSSGVAGPPWPSPQTEFCNNGTSACGVTTGGTCGTGVTCTSSGTDYLFFSVNVGHGCLAPSGYGCVLAYNISNPSSVGQSADLEVPDITSPGCWATGGFVIDNSQPVAAGTSQVYFVGLNGNTAGGAGSATSAKCASGSGNTILGYQASQASLK
jgi:hypothetical protein